MGKPAPSWAPNGSQETNLSGKGWFMQAFAVAGRTADVLL